MTRDSALRREFDMPGPVTATIDIQVGDVSIGSGADGAGSVEIRHANPDKAADRRAAEATTVEYGDERLVVRAPRSWRSWSPVGHGGAVEVAITLPAGSELSGSLAMGTIRSTGRLGACRLRTGAGKVRLADVAEVTISTGAGDVSVEQCRGDAVVKTGTGEIRLGIVGGSAVVKNSSGATRVGEVAGDLRARSAAGSITAERCGGSVSAKTAAGSVRLGGLRQGVVEAETAMGAVEIGVVPGVAVWLELGTGLGSVDNQLEAGEPPAPGEPQVKVRAHTGAGNITARHDTVPV